MTVSTKRTSATFAAVAVITALVAALTSAAIATYPVEAARRSARHAHSSNVRRARPHTRIRRPAPARASRSLTSRSASAFRPRATGYSILVDKSARRMTVYLNGQPFRTYSVHLSDQPVGAKSRRADRRTPEGTYYVARRNAESRFYRSLLISYPSPEDARRGVQAGLVGQETLAAVIGAWRSVGVPPQDTPLGGDICIHGDGPRAHSGDWTAGCVAVTNAEMAEIFRMIPVGTPVTILP